MLTELIAVVQAASAAHIEAVDALRKAQESEAKARNEYRQAVRDLIIQVTPAARAV